MERPKERDEGSFHLTAELDDRVRRLSGAPPRGPEGRAHPIFAYLGALGGMTVPIGEFSRRCGVDFDAGPVLGACRIAFPAPLEVGRSYDVTVEATGLQRKPSRRFGAADHLSLRLTLSWRGAPQSLLEFTMIAPAREV